MRKLLLASIVSLSIFACNDNDEKSTSYDTSLTSDSSFSVATPVTIADTSLSGSEASSLNTTGSTNSTTPSLTIPEPTMPQQAKPAVTTSGKQGLNPAHGQPGHRCDIAVGAPLSSPAASITPTTTTKQASPKITSAPSTSPALAPAITTPAGSSAPGVKLNPAHGQPGHDCAKAVGAPL